MRIDRSFVLLIALLALASSSLEAQGKGQTPRAAVISFFNSLKAGQYDALYDQLPSQVQQQASREQTVNSLKRLGAFIVMERMDVGQVQQRGDHAVIDTTIFGRLTRPMKVDGEEIAEGRVVVQQYLIKEGKEWRVITADDRTRAYFLRQNPEFSRGFTLSSPQFSYKKDGSWHSLMQRAPNQGGSRGNVSD